ncbi:MAG: hypothetical protein QHC79_25580 [Pseudosphingobacterium sp.]|nr:hypothetical protein [Pseudosphingobacterium sp.]
MKTLYSLLCLFMLSIGAYAQITTTFPQVTTALRDGVLTIKEGDAMGRPSDALYKSVTDSANALLKKNPADTNALFLTALMESQKFILLSGLKDVRLPALQKAETAINKAFDNGISSLTAKALRARIYYQLKECFYTDEGWMYKNDDRKKRKALFERYQELANKYNGEMITLDPSGTGQYKSIIKEEKYRLEVK